MINTLKKITINRLSILFLLPVLVGCWSGSDSDQQSKGKIPSIDTLSYQYTEYTRYSDQLVKTTETTDTTYFSVSYPVFEDTTINQFIRKSLLGDDTMSVEEAADQFIGEF